MKDNLKFIYLEEDVNFFPIKEQKEVQKVVERYIKKTKPIIVIKSSN